jgi:hypothetical protein
VAVQQEHEERSESRESPDSDLMELVFDVSEFLGNAVADAALGVLDSLLDV